MRVRPNEIKRKSFSVAQLLAMLRVAGINGFKSSKVYKIGDGKF